jgi:hypothetical protein
MLTVVAMLFELALEADCELDPPQAMKVTIRHSANPKPLAFMLLIAYLMCLSVSRNTSVFC